MKQAGTEIDAQPLTWLFLSSSALPIRRSKKASE